MCGRFALYSDQADLEAFFGMPLPENWEPRYNIAPTQKTPVIRRNHSGTGTLDWLSWGLVPHWARDKTMAGKSINARSETVMEKPSFKKPFQKQRCLVPASGFYEWKANGKAKVPFFITQPDGSPWTFAGIWDRNENLLDGPLDSFSILTTQANSSIQHLHHRMPVVVPKDHWRSWLADQDPGEALARILEQSSMTSFHFQEVNPMVNKVSVDAPICITPPARGLFD